SKRFSKAIPFTSWDEPDIIKGYITGAKTTSLAEARNDSYNSTFQFLASYDKSAGEHNFNLMAGYENYYSSSENLTASSDQYLLSSYPYLDLGNNNYLFNGGNATEYASRSY